MYMDYELMVRHQLIAEGIDEGKVSECVDSLKYTNATVQDIYGYSAVYNKDTWDVDIIDPIGGCIKSVSEFAGELNHSTSPTACLISLLVDSGYSLEQLNIPKLMYFIPEN